MFERYLFGFFLWNIDNIFCGNLTSIRTDFLAPKLSVLSPLTQLHGWWHLFAGYATYLHIISCIYHRQKFLKKDADFKICWIGFTVGENAIDIASGKKKSHTKNGGHHKRHWLQPYILNKILNELLDNLLKKTLF